MNSQSAIIPYGNVSIRYKFQYPDTFRYFEKYNLDSGYNTEIQLSEEEILSYKWLIKGQNDLPFLEYLALMVTTGNTLLIFNKCLFHGCAFIWNGKAWIFTAPSGTGKTTQLVNWRRKHGKNIQVINGDKPLLVCHNDGSVTVHSSPWEGKEHFGHPNQHAELGGIVYLSQAQSNTIQILDPSQSVPKLFLQFISLPETGEELRMQGRILSHLISKYPIWMLENTGDMDSVDLVQTTLETYLEVSNE